MQTGLYLFVKRLPDPFGAAAYLVVAYGFIMTQETLVGALEREPFPERLVASLPKLRRPAVLAALSLIAATAVVSLR